MCTACGTRLGSRDGWDERQLELRSLQVNDISLEDYIAVKAKFAVFVPHTAGRYQKKRFRKAQCPIVERCDPPHAQQHFCAKHVAWNRLQLHGFASNNRGVA